ncbi:MAG: hypothetical protein AB8G15_22665 [Saprospiraceae bacterium]
MDMLTSKILAQTSVFLALLPALVALLNWKNLNHAQRLLSNLVFVAVLTELFAYLLARMEVNNLFISHIFTIVEYLLLSLIYRKALSSVIPTKVFNLTMLLFLLYATFNGIWVESLTKFNGLSRAVSSLIILFYALAYFYKLLKEVKIKRLETEALFWLSVGLLLYFSANFFIFIFSNYIQPSVKLSFTFWGIHAILNITRYIFYTIALWIKPPKRV